MARSWKVSSALVIILLVLTIVMPISTSGTASASDTVSSTNGIITINFFYGDGCPHCAIVEPQVESLAAKYPQVSFVKLEVWYNSANKVVFQNFNTQYGIVNPVVPEVFIGGEALIGEVAIENRLEPIIQHLINTNNPAGPPSNSNTEPAGSSASTNHSSSANPTNDVIQATNITPEAPTVIKTPSQAFKYNNTTGQLNINSTEPAEINASTNPMNNIVEGTKPTSEASTMIKTAHPEVTFITADGAVFNSSQAAIKWNYTNGQSSVATVEVAIDGGSFNSLDRNATSYVASGLSNGNHTLNLRINDGSGSSERSLNFTVDLESKTSSSSVSSPLLIGFSAFILIVGISLMFVQRTRRKE